MKFLVFCVCISLSLGATIRNTREPKAAFTAPKLVDQQVQRQLDVYSLNLYSSQNPLLIRANIPNFSTASTARATDSKYRSRVLEPPSLITQQPFKPNPFVLVPAELQYSSVAASPSPNYNDHRGALSQIVKQQNSFPVKKDTGGYKIEKVPEIASFSRVGPQDDIPSISEIDAIFNNATRSTALAKNFSLPLQPRTSFDENVEVSPVSNIAAAAVHQQPIPENDNKANTIATNILKSAVSNQSQTFDFNFTNNDRSVGSSGVAQVGPINVSNHGTTSVSGVPNTEISLFNAENDSESYKVTEKSIENFKIIENDDVANNISSSSNHVINNDLEIAHNTEPTLASSVKASIQVDNELLKKNEHVQEDHSTELSSSVDGTAHEVQNETLILSLTDSYDKNEDKSNDEKATNNVILSNTSSVFTSSYDNSSESSNDVNDALQKVSKPVQIDDTIETNTSDDKNLLFKENAASSKKDENITSDQAFEANTSSNDPTAVETVDLDKALSRNDDGNIINEAKLDLSTNNLHVDSVETTTGYYSETTAQ